jgi:hypothetical protein
MRTVIAAMTAVAVLALPSPAFAIHDGRIDADNCAPGFANAVGDPALGTANNAFSNTILAVHYSGAPQCNATGRPF